MTMFPSACAWIFSAPIDTVLRQLKESAFHYVDVRPETLDAPGALETFKTLGLKVSCVELEPGVSSLDGKDAAQSRKVLEQLGRKLDKAYSLEAKVAYLRPCPNRKSLDSFSAALSQLATHASERGIRLCVEHVPGTALPTAKEALLFVQKVNHPNLYLLLDVGHALLSNEAPWDVVAAAGQRLGYVQLNDNDGKKDRHWALLDGCLTLEGLSRTLEALLQAGYQGALGLQLSPRLRVLPSEFSRNRNLLLRMQMATEPKSMKEPETRRKQ
jgi:sugar phosphate isomerase/epimerase